MKSLKEYDSFSITKSIIGRVIGQPRETTIPISTIATAVLLHGNPDQPEAYEIEVYLPDQDCYMLTTMDADQISMQCQSSGL